MLGLVSVPVCCYLWASVLEMTLTGSVETSCVGILGRALFDFGVYCRLLVLGLGCLSVDAVSCFVGAAMWIW